jgi:TP901 family phage tail tape measure protein
MRDVYELAILLSLKDAASGGLNRIEDRLRAAGKEGRATVKTFQDLRADLKRDLTIAGAGVASLAMLRAGVQEAGNFEAAMADLRMSIEEVSADGRVNMQKLNSEIGRFETLGVRLGNMLPGTTQDFIEMFSTLKQGGLSTETILNGTGEAVANLAVITKQVPKDLAEPFAQYAQQFQLTGEEAKKLTSVLAKIQFATGLKPQELIEGSKFFQLRAGLPLGLTGLSGADVSGRLLATLRSFGLEGGIGGRELGGFMLSLNFNTKDKQKMLAELKSQKGIELQFFDKKGSFLGMENVFKQMEKFRKLSTQEQLKFGEKLFDREGMAIASVFMKAGVEGWHKINQRIDKIPDQQDLINQKTATYNAKLEAVKGTLTNLEATAFTPMLDRLKPLLDLTNQEVGSLQEWAKANPGITGTATALFAMGGVTLTVVGGIGAMTTAWRLWKIASSVGINEAGQLTFLRTLRAETTATSTTMTVAAGRAGLYSRTLGRIPSTVTTTIALIGVEYAITKLVELINTLHEYEEAKSHEHQAGQKGVQSLRNLEQDYQRRGEPVPVNVYSERARDVIAVLNRENELRESLEPGSHFFSGLFKFLTFQPENPYAGGPSNTFDPARASYTIKERAPELASPEIMVEFLKRLREFQLPAEKQGQTQLAEIQRKELSEAIEKAFPESFQKAMGVMNLQSLTGLDTTYNSVTKSLQELQQPINALPAPLTKTSDAATRAAANLDRFSGRLAGFQIPDLTRPAGPQPGQPAFTFTPTPVPSRATGGIVRRGGFVEVHDREAIVPASVTDRWHDGIERVPLRDDVARTILTERTAAAPTVQMTVTYAPHVEITGDTDAHAIGQMLQLHSRELLGQMERGITGKLDHYKERG